MNPIVRTDVLAIAPELSTLPELAWIDLLEYANEFDFTSLDTEQTVRMARIFLIAHMGTRTKRAATGAAGPVLSEAAGGVRRSYGPGSTTTSSLDLGSSAYGITLQSILSMSGAHGPFLV